MTTADDSPTIGYVALLGNPSTGYTVVGPYTPREEAYEDLQDLDGEPWTTALRMPVTPDGRWACDLVQFARLISEMEAAGAVSDLDMVGLCESMDLQVADLNELIERAQNLWERAKGNAADLLTLDENGLPDLIEMGGYLTLEEWAEDSDYRYSHPSGLWFTTGHDVRQVDIAAEYETAQIAYCENWPEEVSAAAKRAGEENA